jgi:ketosteroid isomerase-like protein
VTARRPLADRLEVRAPGVAAALVRLLGRMPPPVRQRALAGAFDRAQEAFNRGDLEVVFALFADDAEYVPPRPLHEGAPLVGRAAVLGFWREVLGRFDASTIENVSVEEAAPSRFVRTARLVHRAADGSLEYAIRQTTELRRGRVVRQVNEVVPDQAVTPGAAAPPSPRAP